MVRDQGYALKTVPGYYGSKPGIQLGTQIRPDATEEQIAFVKQMGIEWVMTSLPEGQQTVEDYGVAQAF